MDKRELTPFEENVKLLIEHHTERLHSHRMGSLFEQLQHVVSEYERNAATALENQQRFQNEMCVWLQALAMIAQMVSNGGTHSEKDARMRGMIEMIESARGKVKEYDSRLDRFNRHSYRHEDLFTNDYPVRYYKEAKEKAERTLNEFKRSLIERPTPLNTDGCNALLSIYRTGERSGDDLTLDNLVFRGLITKDPDGHISMTPMGMAAAELLEKDKEPRF